MGGCGMSLQPIFPSRTIVRIWPASPWPVCWTVQQKRLPWQARRTESAGERFSWKRQYSVNKKSQPAGWLFLLQGQITSWLVRQPEPEQQQPEQQPEQLQRREQPEQLQRREQPEQLQRREQQERQPELQQEPEQLLPSCHKRKQREPAERRSVWICSFQFLNVKGYGANWFRFKQCIHSNRMQILACE